MLPAFTVIDVPRVFALPGEACTRREFEDCTLLRRLVRSRCTTHGRRKYRLKRPYRPRAAGSDQGTACIDLLKEFAVAAREAVRLFKAAWLKQRVTVRRRGLLQMRG